LPTQQNYSTNREQNGWRVATEQDGKRHDRFRFMLNEEENKTKGRYKFGAEKTREDMAIS
jgi:hypothetical protein